MKVLLSIKPAFAFKIFEGIKRYEFRKSIFKNPDIKTIVVYASSPVQLVIGEFEIEQILNHDIATLWNKTSKHSGISKEYFYQYFANKEEGFAIKIKNTKRYKEPKSIREHYNVVPPQSFLYLK